MYGSFLYGDIYRKLVGPAPSEITRPDLMQYIPKYYIASSVMIALLDAFKTEIGTNNWSIRDLENQLFVDTATWGLDIWEKELGMYTDLSNSMVSRRENIKAKLRGGGTCTIGLMKNVAESFVGGEVAIIEDNSNYKFTVQFIGIKGIPQNMQGLIDTLDIIKPAHLSYTFKYTYSTWDMVSSIRWGEAITKTWDELKTYE